MNFQRIFDFLKKTFLDTRGVPDGKQLTLFAFSFICALQFPVGWIFGVWAPDHIFYPSMGLIAAGYGFSTWETRSKLRNETERAIRGIPTDENCDPKNT